MIDFHSHILPGMDDGSKDLAESLALVQMPQGRPCRMPAEWVALAAPQE